jgi:SRSO17 transposase
MGVYLAYAGSRGHTLLDERLYLTEEWASDRARREAAGVPDEVVFRTKPELALELIEGPGRQVRHGWVTFDEAYGKDPAFLTGLEELGDRYIGEVPNLTVYVSFVVVSFEVPSGYAFSSRRSGLVPCDG